MMNISILKRLDDRTLGKLNVTPRGWLPPGASQPLVKALAEETLRLAPEKSMVYLIGNMVDLIRQAPWLVDALAPTTADDPRVRYGLVGLLFGVPAVTFVPRIAGRPKPGFTFSTWAEPEL